MKAAEDQETKSAARTPNRLWLLASAVVVAIGFSAQFAYPPNDDATWLFTVARRVLAGASLYSRDIIEINPPLIFELNMLAVRVAAWLGVEPMMTWRVMVLTQVLLAVAVSARLLAVVLGSRAVELSGPLLVFLAGVFACLPGYDFGQREHLIVLWLSPYLIASAGRASGTVVGRTAGIVVGALLGLTLCLKPHYGIAVALVELGVVAHVRSWKVLVRRETVTGAVVFALYGLWVAWWTPAFYTTAIPLASRFYPAYGSLKLRPIHAVYWICTFGALWLSRTPRSAGALGRIFALAGAGAFLAFVLQDKGWPYHFLPCKSFLMVVVATAIALHGRRWVERLGVNGRPGLTQAATVALTVLVIVTSALWTSEQLTIYQRSRQARVVTNVTAFLENVPTTDGRPPRFAALSLTLFPAFPVNELLHARWGLRFSCLWVLPAVLADEGEATPASLERSAEGRQFIQTAVNEDFERWRPSLVLVEQSNQISVLDELLKGEVFREVWSLYDLVGEVEYFQVFRRR